MSYESRISAEVASNSYDLQTDQLKKHKKIVAEIKAKDTEETNNFQTNPDKVKQKSNITGTQNPNIHRMFKPIFKWEKDNDQKFNILPSEKNVTFNSLYDVGSSSNHILSILGYKIDINDQVDQFKQKFQKFFIESKSHNELIGKFSELKFGLMASLLTLLGVEPNTIDKLKKDALKKAIADNVECFEQNEYNIELLTIFSKNRKDKGREKILKKLREQLVKQMKKYGQEDYYTKSTIYAIKKQQIQKILIDLLEEKQNLTFLRNFQ